MPANEISVLARCRDRRHGLISLGIMALAFVQAFAELAAVSPRAAGLYLLVLAGGSLLVLWRFCGRCPSRGAGCRHVLPGLLAKRLPGRTPGFYGSGDLIWTAAALGAMIGFPQPWLWQQRTVLVIFWLLVLAALVEILWKVCPDCANRACPIQLCRPR